MSEVRGLELRTTNFELRVAPFSHVSRFTRHALCRWRLFQNPDTGKQGPVARWIPDDDGKYHGVGR